jgi:hypothetical protein
MTKLKTFWAVMLLALSAMAFAQSQYSDVDPSTRPSNVVRAQLPQTNRGGLTFYTDQASFEAAAPGLTMEDFASSITAPNNICVDFVPLNSATLPDACFASGDLEAGFTLEMEPVNDDYAYLTTGFLGVPFDVIGPNTFTDNLVINFDGAAAVGFDLLGDVVGAVTCDVEIFGASGLLGTTQITGSSTGNFWGVIATEDITEIVLTGTSGSDGELIGHLQYGSAGCTITGIGVDGNGTVSLSGSCPAGVSVDIWASTDCNLTSVNGGNATLLGSMVPGVEDFPFQADSCYYAADAAGNVLAVSGQTVPTLGEWGLIAFVMLLMVAGMAFMRKRRLA